MKYDYGFGEYLKLKIQDLSIKRRIFENFSGKVIKTLRFIRDVYYPKCKVRSDFAYLKKKFVPGETEINVRIGSWFIMSPRKDKFEFEVHLSRWSFPSQPPYLELRFRLHSKLVGEKRCVFDGTSEKDTHDRLTKSLLLGFFEMMTEKEIRGKTLELTRKYW